MDETQHRDKKTLTTLVVEYSVGSKLKVHVPAGRRQFCGTGGRWTSESY